VFLRVVTSCSFVPFTNVSEKPGAPIVSIERLTVMEIARAELLSGGCSPVLRKMRWGLSSLAILNLSGCDICRSVNSYDGYTVEA
jgi:hypothetical protein